MRDEVDGLVSTEVDPEQDRVRPACSIASPATCRALGFLIDMLSVQPQHGQVAVRLRRRRRHAGARDGPQRGTDSPATPVPAPVEPRLIEQAQMLAFTSVREDVPVEEVTRDLERLSHEAQAADQPALAAAVLKAQEALEQARAIRSIVASARGELSEALVDFVATATEPAGFAPVSAPVPLAPMAPITLVEDFEHDDEMREIFLEEAREVVETARRPRAPSCSRRPATSSC